MTVKKKGYALMNLTATDHSRIILASGAFAYELIPYWAQFPEGFHEKAEITAMACDAADRVYVLTRDSHMPVLVFDKDGTFLFSFGAGVFYARPHGVFINKVGEIYCTDDKAHVAMKFSHQGKLLKVYGTPHIPSHSGCNWNAYEEYRAANHIPEHAPIDWPLSLKLRLDTIVRSAGPFNGPTKMIEAEDGELFCSDGYGNAAIHRFTHEGELLGSFGAPGRENGQFRLPHAVHLDSRQRLWVADRENGRVQIFSREGAHIKSLTNLKSPADFCTDGELIYVGQTQGGGVAIYNEDFVRVADIGYHKSPLYFHGIAMDSEKSIYGATLSKNRAFNLYKLKRI